MTSTVTEAPSTRLHKLNLKRERALEALRKVKTKAEAWNTEKLPASVPPGSFQYDQAAAQRERDDGPNPYTAELDQARAAFKAADEAVSAFQTEHLDARLAEHEHAAETGVQMIHDAFSALLRGCEVYAVAAEESRGVVISTPRLDGRDLDADPRVNDWAQLARAVLDGSITLPGLTPHGRGKVS